MRERNAQAERRVLFGSLLGRPFLWALAHSWRIRTVNDATWRRMHAAGKPLIISFWHGELLPSIWYFRDQGVTTMVSEHADGEIIARIVEAWGYETVRGSTSRGAGRALLQMVRRLQAGATFAITPDGPRGPAGVPESGTLLASMRSGTPILPVRVHASREWRMRSWDHFLVPKPFARVTVSFGEPWVAEGTGEADVRLLIERMGPPDGTLPRSSA